MLLPAKIASKQKKIASKQKTTVKRVHALARAAGEAQAAARMPRQDNRRVQLLDAAARLFVPFASSKPTGMGIGLSICRSFVELHQGRLWFTRNAERGATFHVGLPLMKTPAQPANPTSAS